MMAAGGKKKPEKNTGTLDIERSLRDDAEEQIARSRKHSPELKGQTPEQLIHELQVHQIELEAQAEELRRAHLALEDSRDKFLELYELAPNGYLTLNDKALVNEANLTCATLIGIERSKLIRAQFGKFVAQKDSDQWFLYFRNALNRDGKQICTLLLKRSDDSVFPARLEGIRTTGSDGAITVRFAISDITDIWQIEALRESEERYRLMNDASLDFIYSYDRSGRFTSANRSLCAALNKSVNQIIGRTHTELGFPDAQCRDWEELHKRVYETGTIVTAFTSTPMPDGTIRQYEVVLNPLHDSTGTITGITGTTRDITERKQQELALFKNSEELHASYEQLAAAGEELKSQFDALADSERIIRESEGRFNQLAEQSRTLVWEVDARGLFTYVSHVFEIVLGYRPDELVGRMHFYDLHPVSGREEFRIAALAVFGQKEPFQNLVNSVQAKDGRVMWVSTNGIPLLNADWSLRGYRGSDTDITERRQAEIALLQSTKELHTTYDELAAAGEELKSQFDALADSERMIRLSEERLIIAEEIGHTGCWEYNYNLVNNNSWASAELLRIFGFPPVAGNFPIEKFEACIPERERVHQAMIDLIRADKDYNLEFAINPADGSAPKMIHSIARLEKDAMGNPLRILGVAKDITDRKLAESTLQRVNQKLNVLSQLTRQDLTTQIFVLNSYLEMAKTHATGQDGIIKNIESSERAVRSIKEIMEFTKDYQNMGEKPPKYQNVKLSFLFGLSHISIGEIQHSLETENLEIFADPLLEKAFQGMLENSVKHGGHVSHIRVSHTVTPDSVTIVYEDDGVGIHKDKKERIFLRGEGARASVRGLVFVREILDITGITITETGEPGKGARFEMTVPKGSYRLKPEKGNGQDSGP